MQVPSLSSSLRLGALVVAAMLSTAPFAEAAGPAPAETTPQATTAIYRDWQLHCVAGNPAEKAAPAKTCEVAGVAPTADGKGVAARVVLGRPNNDKTMQIVIQLAPGVWLPAGATFSVSGAQPLKAEFKQCVQVCFAQADVDTAIVTAMRAADKPATVSFQDAQQQTVTLPISLNGFSAALDGIKP